MIEEGDHFSQRALC